MRVAIIIFILTAPGFRRILEQQLQGELHFPGIAGWWIVPTHKEIFAAGLKFAWFSRLNAPLKLRR